MKAVRQEGHWTVAHEDRRKIQWDTDLLQCPYWMWVECATGCLRLQKSWTVLSATSAPQRLLALVEYAVAWWALQGRGIVLDFSTCCWLRTGYEVSKEERRALDAHVDGKGVFCCASGPGSLHVGYVTHGGRMMEVCPSVSAV